MPSKTVKPEDQRKVYSLSVPLGQYPRLREFMENAPAGHRSAIICQVMEEHLTWEEERVPTMREMVQQVLAALDRIPTQQIEIEAPSAFVQAGQRIELDRDIIANLLELGE